MKPGSVPTARIAPVLYRLISERWPYGGGLEVLAEKVGCEQSSIEQIIDQTWPGVSFDLADSLLCALGRWDMWHGELADIYPTKFVETCALPGCNRKFPERGGGSRIKRCCSPKCSNLYVQMRLTGRTGERLVQRGRCLRGHKLTGDNLYISPKSGQRVCVTCRRNKRRERLADPEFRARQNRFNREHRSRKKAAACK